MKKKIASQSGFFNPRGLIGLVLCSLGLALALFGFGINRGGVALAQASQVAIQQSRLTEIPSYHHDVSPALRDMPRSSLQAKDEHESDENSRPSEHLGDRPNPIVQSKSRRALLAPNIPGPILNFDGTPSVGCNCSRPNTNGAAGATQYVQVVTGSYQIFNKANGASILGPNSIASLWSGFGGVCQTSDPGNPIVLYDQLADRWLISHLAGSGIPTDACVAISTTSDATGTWNRYAFHLSSNFFSDPRLSVWPDGYYMSMNVFNSSGTAFLGPQAFAFNRSKMLSGLSASVITLGITGGPNEGPFLPADLDGSILPPPGAPNSFVEFPRTGVYKVWHFHADFSTPANSSFTLFAAPPAAAFTLLCPTAGNCVPQSGTTTTLDGVGNQLMIRLAYRNFGTSSSPNESIIGNYSVSANGVAGVRWFELNGVTAGPVTVRQESTYQPDNTWRWLGSAAMDHSGNLAIGFSASSAAINPQIRYAGRLANDPLNILAQGEAHLFDGTGSQVGSSGWGNYSSMTVDPVDDTTLWYTNEYYDAASGSNWRTRIGNFRIDPNQPLQLVGARSRKIHGGSGPFDINLPLGVTSRGEIGIEPRSGGANGDYTIIFSFSNAVTSVVMGTPSCGTVGSSMIDPDPANNNHRYIVNLTSLNSCQDSKITVPLNSVSDGTNSISASVTFGLLVGDTTGNATVNASDVSQVKAQSGQAAGPSNFRQDVNADGALNASDIGLVKSRSGAALPPP